MIPSATIDLWIQLANVSAGLSGNDNNNKRMFSGGAGLPDLQTPFLLDFFSDIVTYAKTAFAGTTTLDTLSLYMYSLCGQWIPQASIIITNQTGQVINNGSVATPVLIGSELLGTAGVGNGPTIGSNTFTPLLNGLPILAGASNIGFIIVSNNTEMAVGSPPQFTFDSITGTITRVNTWQPGDTYIIPYSKALGT